MKYLDYIDTWLKYKKNEYSFSTLKTYKGLINKHFRPFFKDRQIEDLTRLELQNFINTLTTSQKVCIALQWSDVLWYTKDHSLVQQREYDQCTYVVLKITKTFDEHQCTNHEPKTAFSIRDVIVTDPTTIELLANQWSDVGYPENSYIAQSRRCSNQPVSRVAIKNIFRKATEALELPFVLTPHHARLNYTSHSLANGVSEKNLQAQLGHSNSNLIRTVYGKAIGNRLEELIDKPNVYYFR